MKISVSGIRGIFGKDLTLKEIMKYCKNFSILVESKKCVIGRDTRLSGSVIQENVAAVLMKCGIDVYNLGMVPTPVVFRESRKYGAGIIITSSHNPPEWNGLKFITKGRGINEQELETVVENSNVIPKKFGKEIFINSNYEDEVLDKVGIVKNKPNVIIDLGGGAAKNVAPRILEKIGCNVKKINVDLSTSSRGPDPTSDNLQDLISKTGMDDIGFAFDLDGDRLVVVHKGKKLYPDATLGLGISRSLELGYKKFVLSQDTSASIEKFIKENGGSVNRSKVGEANVIDLMLKNNAEAGGEGSSGGFILPEFNYCRDGIMTSGMIASIFGTKTFSNIIEFMNNYFLKRDKISIEVKYHDKTLEKFDELIKNQYSETSHLDGIKAIIDEKSWVLVRKSNTEDIIRISVESSGVEKMNKIYQQVEQQLMQCYEQIK